MKKLVMASVLGASLMVGSYAMATETVVVQNVPNGSEVTVVSGPEVDHLRHLVKEMDLTQAQKDKIHAVLQAADPKFQSGMQAAEANSKLLMALSGTNYDATKVATLADAQGKLVADAIKLRLQVRHEIYEILTPKQRTDLRHIMQAEQNM